MKLIRVVSFPDSRDELVGRPEVRYAYNTH